MRPGPVMRYVAAIAVALALPGAADARLVAHKGHGHGHVPARKARRAVVAAPVAAPDSLSHAQAAPQYQNAVTRLQADGVALDIRDADNVDVQAMVVAAARVPDAVLRRVHFRIEVSAESVCTWADGPDCSQAPRGWGDAGTWDDADGADAVASGSVILRGTWASRLTTPPHEVGHVIGGQLGIDTSDGMYAELRRLYFENKLDDYEKQGGDAGRQELFADGVSEYVTNGPAATAARYDDGFASFIAAALS